jgi:protein-disulfide isomerase
MKEQTQTSQKNSWATPIAIIIAGGLIGFAIFLGEKTSPTIAKQPIALPPTPEIKQKGNLEAMAPITKEDHVRGSLNAPVKIVEYSDTECPFCKRFHNTMKEVMSKEGKEGKVAWVYRHLPLDRLHSKARKEAEATECAGELGGNDKFWAYLDRLMEITPANNRLDLAELPKIAEYVGLNTVKFNECLTSGRYAKKIEGHAQNAAATGGSGTPWSIVVGKDGKKYPLSGAQPYSAIKQLIDIASK